jgi:hypothetical protein
LGIMAVSWTSLGITLVIDLSVCIVVLLCFNLTRLNKHAKRYYAAKRYLRVPFRYRPRKPSTSFFLWPLSLMRYTDDEIVACAGMDALTVIQFLTFGAHQLLANQHMFSIGGRLAGRTGQAVVQPGYPTHLCMSLRYSSHRCCTLWLCSWSSVAKYSW